MKCFFVQLRRIKFSFAFINLPEYKLQISAAAIIFFIIMISGCSSRTLRPDLPAPEGWVDGDTYRVRAVGSPQSKSHGRTKRRFDAREAAVMQARKIIYTVLFKVDATGDYDTVPDKEISYPGEFAEIKNREKIVSENFDLDDNCEVYYQVSYPALKKNVLRYRNMKIRQGN